MVPEADLAFLFTCQKCGHHGPVGVQRKGEGQAKPVTEADRKHETLLASLFVAGSPCPRCGHANDSFRETARTRILLVGAGMMAVPLLVGVGKPAVIVPGLLAAFVVAAYYYGRASYLWKRHDDRFVIVKDDEPEVAQPVDGVRPALVWGETLGEAPLNWPFLQSLHLGLLRLEDEGPSWLDPKDLSGEAESEARAKAMANLERASHGGLSEVEPGVLRGEWKDGIAASRLALPHLFKDLTLEGSPVAFTASEDTLFIAGSQNAAALERAFALSKQHLEKVRADDASPASTFTAHPWVLNNGDWAPWQVPEEHPLRAEIASFDATLGSNAWRPS